MKTLLDTNVLSELVRPMPDASVLAWFENQPDESLWVSAVTQAEMMLGARILPNGKRRLALQRALATIFDEEFEGRILGFDCHAVQAYVDIVAARRNAGRPVSQFDAQIAAIARHHGARVATRNVSDFEGCGVVVVDPWSSPRG